MAERKEDRVDVHIPPAEHEIGVTPLRWFILAIFCFNTLINSILWICFSSIADRVQAYYNTSSLWVDMLSLVYFAMTLLFMYPAVVVIEKYGLYVGTITPIVMQCVGSWIRYAGSGKSDMLALLIGQTICGCAQPFFISLPPRVAITWFATEERTRATAFSTMSNMGGVIFGFLSSYIVRKDASNLPQVLLYQALVTTALGAIAVVFFKSRPQKSPSYTAQRGSSSTIWEALKLLFSRRSFCVLAIFFGIGVGLLNTFMTLLEQIIKPYHYDSDDAALMGSLIIVCGFVGAAIFSSIVDKTHAYKKIIVIGFVGALAMICVFLLVLKPGMLGYLAASCGGVGFFGMSLLPVCLETGCEVSYPVPEQLVAGAMLAVGQIFGISFTVAGNAIGFRHKHIMIFLAAMAIIAFVMAVFFRGTYRRLQQDEEGEHSAEHVEAGNIQRARPTNEKTPLLSSS